MVHQDLLYHCIQAAIAAGEAILEVYHQDHIESETKADESPLTQADLASNAILMEQLELTGIPIISEEIKNVAYTARKNWEECWIIDPLDGTKEFLNRNGEFTVNIALLVEGKLQMGIIYVPVTGGLYFTNSTMTAAYRYDYKDELPEIEELLEKSVPLLPHKSEELLKIVGSKSHMNEATLAFIENLKKESHREVVIETIGSSLKFCLVASGVCEVYPRFGPTMEWDIAAGQALCEAVGLQVLNAETNLPLQYNKEDLYHPFFIVR
ncbi:3'(2'),5'-bisphosphate nucleotidase CysQ [Nonlabens sp.]|uniref:3'(2'),5'-bisphosphate nucleotidase CysQ n=1 Tax=Nonlabens sp. TaxID=1888209 RepID=UPI001BD09E45|nr:3'(2'),5'-bisphosphate nucleotidase CysQ [Nonlabens sp.]